MTEQTETKPTFTDVKKRLGLKDADIAKAFGYKNRAAYYNSSARARIEEGVVNIFTIIHSQIADKLKDL